MSEQTKEPEQTEQPVAVDVSPSNVIFLTRSQILRAKDIKTAPVDVPEWLPEDAPPDAVARVYVKGLSGTEREKYIESIREVVGTGKNQSVKIILQKSGAKLAAKCLCDKDGNKLFSEADVDALGEKSSKALDRVINAAAELNGLNEEAVENAKNNSALTKN
jgi:hypothetical protein